MKPQALLFENMQLLETPLFAHVKKPEFDSEKEQRFREYFAGASFASARLIIAQIIIVFLLAGYLDYIMLGELATLMMFLRYAVFMPVLVSVFIFSLTPWFKARMQVTFSVLVCVVSCYVALFTFLNEEIVALIYFAGVIVVVFVSFVYVPILFNYALVLSIFVFAVSLLGLLYNDNLSAEVFQACVALLFASTVLSLTACYANERNTRLNFQYRELLNLEKDNLQESNIHLQALARHDGLTGINNRRAFDERLLEEWRRAERSKTSLAILLLDVDHFKLYNDFYGHQVGDDCLRKLARALDHMVGRVGDSVARYGGEEFVMILPNADIQQATEFAEKVIKKIEALRIPHEKSPVSSVVTLSIGVASAIPGSEDYQEAEFLTRDADRALYQAKSEGRNRAVAFSPLH
jgi:diguanylate cyclase (GGDEF)-like protein